VRRKKGFCQSFPSVGTGGSGDVEKRSPGKVWSAKKAYMLTYLLRHISAPKRKEKRQGRDKGWRRTGNGPRCEQTKCRVNIYGFSKRSNKSKVQYGVGEENKK